MGRSHPVSNGSTPILAPSKCKKGAIVPPVTSRSTTPSPEDIPAPASPLASSSSSCSSSESDDSFYKPKNTTMSTAPPANLAPIVEHHSLHHAPILTAGVPSPAVLLEFEDACEDFFANAKGGVNVDVRVTRILPSFKDPIIRGWISSDRAHLSSLTFEAFMKLIRSKFLSKQWEDELLSKILRDHLRPGQDFLTWATKLQQQNCILRNTDSQLDEKRLREQISIAVDMDLRISAREAKANEATTLRDFLDIYTLCDDKRRAAENRTRSIIDESYRKNKNSGKDNTFHPYKKDGRPSSSSASNPSSSSTSRPPKLTPTEIEIIKACYGCFKCRKVYLSKDHITAEPSKKTCEFPSGENYRPLTWDYANKIKALRELKKASSAKAIASTASASSSTSTPSTSSIVDVNSSDESNFVASMFGPLATSAVLGNGSLIRRSFIRTSAI